MRVSIIIPTLNEERVLGETLRSLQSLLEHDAEIIVVDGGSHDLTVEIAQKYADNVFSYTVGRAKQLNIGAEKATGDMFLFLHADTQLPPDTLTAITVDAEKEYWGRFNVKLDGSQLAYRIIESMMNWRSCLTGVVTGDHALFVSKALFQKVGGFPEIELMEDIEISKALKKVARPRCISSSVLTSSRRWQKGGLVPTVVLMWRLRFAYFMGAEPGELNKLYRAIR